MEIDHCQCYELNLPRKLRYITIIIKLINYYGHCLRSLGHNTLNYHSVIVSTTRNIRWYTITPVRTGGM